MLRLRRLLPLLLMLLWVSPASAAQPGAACNQASAPSALNEYCEDVPSASGGTTPTAVTPVLGSPARSSASIPAAVAKRIQAAPATSPLHRLLTIPARPADRRVRAVSDGAHSVAAPRTVDASTSSIARPLILALVVITLLLAGVALLRGRSRRSG